jgi:DNA polymerase-1
MAGAGRIFLIDGSAQLYRAYHAIRGLTGPQGKSTNAVYGFVAMLRKLLDEHRPELIAVAFDLPGPTFRTTLASDYKANRPPMPSDLSEQVPWVHEACEALGVSVVTAENYEADDVIGTLATRAVAQQFDVTIVAGDKDFFQLVNDGIRIFNPRDQGTWFDAKGVRKKFGVKPEQVVDVLALMGDATDNVKGVPGIGEKGARELIETFGSLDELLKRVTEVTRKKHRTALETHSKDALQSRALVQIHTDVAIAFDPDSFRYQGPNTQRCFKLFSDLGFRTLVADYAPTISAIETDYEIIRSPADLETLIAAVKQSGRCAVHVLADSAKPMQASLVGIALSFATGHGRYIPLGHLALGAESNLDLSKTLESLSPLLRDPTVAKIGHNLKFGGVLLARYGVPVEGFDVDTMIVSYVLDATRSSHRFEDLSLECLGYKTTKEDELLGRGSKARLFSDFPPEAVVEFCSERSDLTLRLADHLQKSLADDAVLESLYRKLELPLIPVLSSIERAGVNINTEVLTRMSHQFEESLATLQREIYELAETEFNINSPKQLSDVLFEKLKLPTTKRTGKTRVASTSVQVLEELAAVHNLPRKVLDWRSLKKLKSTYIDALPRLVNQRTGRVHTSFNQAVAATGRLSSSEPNLQNIPVRTALGLAIRGAFIARPGAVLISADYSQIELRVLAHLSGDESLIAAFKRGEDIHTQTALKVFGTKSGLDPHELRRRAKIVNYALLYGKTAFTLAKDIGVSQAAAQAFIDAYFDGFPSVRDYIDEIIAQARKSGFVSTMFGRQRRVPELTSRNGQVRAAAERVTVNLPIQGTAADILKRAMISIYPDLPAETSMILTVHDELLFEVPEITAESVASLVQDRMEHVVSLDVPLTVDLGLGPNWKEAKG